MSTLASCTLDEAYSGQWPQARKVVSTLKPSKLLQAPPYIFYWVLSSYVKTKDTSFHILGMSNVRNSVLILRPRSNVASQTAFGRCSTLSPCWCKPNKMFTIFWLLTQTSTLIHVQLGCHLTHVNYLGTKPDCKLKRKKKRTPLFSFTLTCDVIQPSPSHVRMICKPDCKHS